MKEAFCWKWFRRGLYKLTEELHKVTPPIQSGPDAQELGCITQGWLERSRWGVIHTSRFSLQNEACVFAYAQWHVSVHIADFRNKPQLHATWALSMCLSFSENYQQWETSKNPQPRVHQNTCWRLFYGGDTWCEGHMLWVHKGSVALIIREVPEWLIAHRLLVT